MPVGTAPGYGHERAADADRELTGCEQARRAQEGRRRRWRGSKGGFREEGRLRKYQEEGGRCVGSYATQQDIERGHQRKLEEAVREQRNIRTCRPPHQAPAPSNPRAGREHQLIWSQTYIGHVLVSVNPFRDCTSCRQLPLRGADSRQWAYIQTRSWIATRAKTG